MRLLCTFFSSIRETCGSIPSAHGVYNDCAIEDSDRSLIARYDAHVCVNGQLQIPMEFMRAYVEFTVSPNYTQMGLVNIPALLDFNILYRCASIIIVHSYGRRKQISFEKITTWF